MKINNILKVISFFLIGTGLISSSSSEPIKSIVDNGSDTGMGAYITNSGSQIITISKDQFSIWDVNTGTLINKVFFPPKTKEAIQFGGILDISMDDKYALISALPLDAQLWNLETSSIVQTFSSPFKYDDPIPGIWGGAISPDGKYSVTHNSYGTLQVWDNETGKEIYQFKYIGGSFARDMKFTSTGKEIFEVAGYATILNPFTGEIHLQFPGSYAYYDNKNEKLFLFDNEDQDLNLYDTRDGHKIQKIADDQHRYYKHNFIVSPDMKYILFRGMNDENRDLFLPRVYMDASNGKVLKQVEMQKGTDPDSPYSHDNQIQFFPDGKRFITVNGKSVHIWDISEFTSSVKNAEQQGQ